MADTERYRFLPRFGLLAKLSVGLGALLLIAAALGAVGGVARTGALALGSLGILLGIVYLASPAWKMVVEITANELAVVGPRRTRFRLAWDDVNLVIRSRESAMVFVDGGEPERSLLIPGPGAGAPYDIENKAQLIETILHRVGSERVVYKEDHQP